MASASSLCGVILAAGDSTRMGTDKALLPWPPGAPGTLSDNTTFLSSAILSLLPFNELVIVVAGKNEANLAPVVYSNGASLVRNPAPDNGQFSSLRVGLQEVLNRGRDAAMVTLVDRPPARLATLQTLCAAFMSRPDETWALIPEFGGKHGHPFLIGREMMEVFLRASPISTAREIEHQNRQHISYVRVDDPAVTLNVDTPQDYSALSSTPRA
jgi:molybdenum cofactor cytidylyltransferase